MLVESKISQEPTPTLKQVVEAYGRDQYNPELLTQFMRAFWAEAGQRIGKNIVVRDFPSTSEEIIKHRNNNIIAIASPPEVGLVDLGKMFPRMGSWATQEGNSVVDVVNNSGWLWIEASVDAPNLNTTQGQLEEKFKKEGREGQSLRTHIVGSQISKLLTDRYFDEGPTWSRLLGSCRGGRVLESTFCSNGDLSVFSDWSSESHSERMGGRSEEVIKP